MDVIKYKLGDLAKDFGLSNKDVIAALGDYGADKKHTTVLKEEELNYFFDEITKKNTLESFEKFLDSAPAISAEAQAKETRGAARPAQQASRTAASTPARELTPKQPPKPPRTPSGPAPSKERVLHVIDTSASVVNVDRFNDRYETIAQAARTGGGMNTRRNQNQTNRQKLNQRSRQRRPGGIQRQRQETEAQRLERIQLEKARKAQLRITIPDEISVGELASRLKATAPAVIKTLMGLGVMSSVSDIIDYDTASLVADEMGAAVSREVVVTIEERLSIGEDFELDVAEDLTERPPVVVVMGHVDHGKTSLLDYIRKTNVIANEAGGITQHIGAYQVDVGGKKVTFLDTPGHEAFTAMRARGASITDIAILVVAADDGIMPQTIEAINHAKAAGVSVIVAINKIDKPAANPERVKQELTEYGLIPEEWGGETICASISALTGEGVDSLLEMIMILAEVKELKANPGRLARGAVVEAELDKGRGPVATVLIQNGTLHQGDFIIAGTAVGRVRNMSNASGEKLESAGPSTPVEITGLVEVPAAGDSFNAVGDEKLARELVERRRNEQQQQAWGSGVRITLENLFSQIAEGALKELPIIVKADVQGSAEAVKQSLEKLGNEEVRVRIIHEGVGAINASDIMLADASGAIIIGFNVRPDSKAQSDAEQKGVEIKMYRVIYNAIEEVEAAIKGMRAPKIRELEQGRVEVREIYRISSVGIVAGSYVLSGAVSRDSLIRIVREGIIIQDDKVATLRRFKDDVREVRNGYECGIVLERFADLRVGDVFEAYVMEEYRD